MSSSFRTIIVVNDQAHISGGAPLVAIMEARGLAARGFRVVFFAGVGPVAAELNHPRIEVVCLGLREILTDPNRVRAAGYGIWNIKAARALATLLAREDAATTLVHFHVWMKCLSPSVLGVPRRAGFKAVLTQHDFFAVCPTGGFYDFGAKTICNRAPLSAACVCAQCDSRSYPQKIWRVGRSLAQKHLARIDETIDLFISVSAFSDRILARHQPFGKRCIVDNPAPMVKLPRLVRTNNMPYLFVGRLSEEKGVWLLRDAARAVDAKVRLVGDGPLRKSLESSWPEAEFLGWQSRESVQQEMLNAKALLFPSLWYETAGLVAIEAAANGLPVIVADTCAATSYVQPGETGLWFKGGDVSAMAAAIKQMNNLEYAERLSTQAYDWYWSNPWTIERHVNDLINAYASLSPA